MWEYHYTDEIYHHGIKGQKWGVRRFQNEDGSLTPAGKRRYKEDGTFKSDKELKKEMVKYREGLLEESRWKVDEEWDEVHSDELDLREEFSRGEIDEKTYDDRYKAIKDRFATVQDKYAEAASYVNRKMKEKYDDDWEYDDESPTKVEGASKIEIAKAANEWKDYSSEADRIISDYFADRISNSEKEKRLEQGAAKWIKAKYGVEYVGKYSSTSKGESYTKSPSVATKKVTDPSVKTSKAAGVMLVAALGTAVLSASYLAFAYNNR